MAKNEKSEETSVSLTKSQSISVSKSESLSESKSVSLSTSESLSNSVSVSKSESKSELLSKSESLSQSISESKSVSASTSKAESKSESLATSESESQVEMKSESHFDGIVVPPARDLYGDVPGPVYYTNEGSNEKKLARFQPPYPNPKTTEPYVFKKGDALIDVCIDHFGLVNYDWLLTCNRIEYKNRFKIKPGTVLKGTYTPTEADWSVIHSYDKPRPIYRYEYY